jgi:molybdopterin-containing oxidoreductase family iron-sulfur binding subunit
MDKNIWIGEKDLVKDEAFIESVEQEFAGTDLLQNGDALDHTQSNRRDFLKYLGFGLGAATMAASCDIPVKRAIPYVVKPDSIVPGVATYYASTYAQGGEYCPVLVKTREGRPIKLEGNDLCNLTEGGTSARAQASVLSLYDTNRYRDPLKNGDKGFEKIDWNALDGEIISALKSSKNIRLVSGTIMSPTAKKAMQDFKSKYPNTQWISYDPVSSAAMLEANKMSFGESMIPSYHFDKADVIVSFNADFLGTWISPVEFARQYSKNRVVDANNPKMSRHIQVESHMSMTGSNADNRVLVKPSEMGQAIAYLHGKLTGSGNGSKVNEKAAKALDKIAVELKNAGSHALIVSGSNNPYEQVLVNHMNTVLGAYGHTITTADASMQRQGNEKDLEALINEMNGGRVDMLILMDVNPAYDSPKAAAFSEALAKVKTKVALHYQPNETAVLCDYVAPTHHYLESWGDVEAKRGHYSLIQPTISPLFNTRQTEESILTWAESPALDKDSDQAYFDYLKANWEANMFPQQSEYLMFQSFWDNSLQDGLVVREHEGDTPSFKGDVRLALSKISKASNSELEIVFFESVNMGNGQFSTNPWLMEMPDPVARTTWGNYLAVPVNFDGNKRFVGLNDLDDGDIVELTIGDKNYRLPVIKQFGMAPGTVALALGYGRREAGTCGTDVGVDINPCINKFEGLNQYYNTEVSVPRKKGTEEHFSCVQYHHTFGVKAEKDGEMINADEADLAKAYGATGYQGSLTNRSVMFTSTLNELDKAMEDKTERREEYEHLNENTLYPFEKYSEEKYSQGHHWGMHVDLNACIGCNACTVACMAENNVPVVGKREVSRHHEMTWLRIDRYYFGDAENPNVVYQPMMCQHCDNAPCENVCPVNATNHSSEGLNQMAYNRCVGTRYCANNCPYKVRRFNWLDYTTADIFPANQPTLNGEEIPFGADNLTRMVLNPDVTVRSRGVIEKCSFCVQRIQEGKLAAKREARRLVDSDVRTACQTACPTGAITFGDRNDKNGELSKKFENPLNFISLEEVNVRSSVNYTMKVVNKDESLEA